MKKTVFTILIIITGTGLWAQTSAEKEFEKFLDSNIEADGSYTFNSLCRMDTVYTMDSETGELAQTIVKYNYKVTKNEDFGISINGQSVSAPFNSKVYNEVGEEIGTRKNIIEFNSKNQFEISGVKDDENSTWEKIGQCWTKTKG